MATNKQIAANRRNAQKSTGPKTAQGKAVSRCNALKSGIDAESEIVHGEKAKELEALRDEYYADHHPATAAERALLDVLIHNEWLLRRLRRIDAALLDGQFNYLQAVSIDFSAETAVGESFERAARTFERLQRRLNAAQRNYERALKELHALQSARIQATSEELASFRQPPARASESVPEPVPEPPSGTPAGPSLPENAEPYPVPQAG